MGHGKSNSFTLQTKTLEWARGAFGKMMSVSDQKKIRLWADKTGSRPTGPAQMLFSHAEEGLGLEFCRFSWDNSCNNRIVGKNANGRTIKRQSPCSPEMS